MADKKISQLTSATTLTGAELVPVVQAGATVQTTVTDLGGAVGYTPAGTGAVATTVQTKLRESVSVKDFGAKGDGVTDDTAAIQAAIDYCVGLYKLLIPAGTYKVTSTLNLYKGSQIEGVNSYQGNDAYSASAIGTKIVFSPTSLKDLFTIQNLPLPAQTFRSKVSVKGLWIVGDGAVNARSALYLTDSIYNDFENLNISSFQYGIYLDGIPINNRFVNIISGGHSTECVHYATAGTTDVWEQCTFNNTPRGVVLRGGSIALRFVNCLFEALNVYGLEIDKDCRAISVINSYCEDVPYTVGATNAMFKVGYSGTSSSLSTTLQVIGGNYAGRNAGATGSLLDVDTASGIQLIGVYAARYTNLITTTANTVGRAVSCAGVQFNSITTYANDPSKLDGFLNVVAVNSGVGSVGYLQSLTTPQLFTTGLFETAITTVGSNGLTTYTAIGGANYLTGTAGASFAVTLPAAASAVSGQKIVIMSTVNRAATTWASAGATVVGAPASLTANTPVCLHYDSNTLSWYISL